MHKCSTLSSAPECNGKIEKPIDGWKTEDKNQLIDVRT